MPVVNMPYKEVDCVRKWLSASQIFDRWTGDRRIFSRTIKENQEWPFPESTFCPDMVTRRCIGCTLISRLVPKELPTAGKVFEVCGVKLVTREAKMSPGGYTKDNSGKLVHQGSSLEHYATISSFMERELSKSPLPSFPLFRWTYRCRGRVVLIEDAVEPILNAPLSSSDIKGILSQLVCTLDYYSRYGFRHNRATPKYLAVENKETNFVYEGVRVNCDVTLRFSPSEDSRISLVANGEVLHISHSSRYNVSEYKVPSGVYELYSFLFGLMAHTEFYYNAGDGVRSIWRDLFNVRDYQRVMSVIYDCHKRMFTPGYTEIERVLRKCKLDPEALKKIIDSLRVT